ncbi:cytochrome P450 724B1 [Momordica charantia]|uniref:Cytochrome P450 724B1 n=1 Tax=Momordica charantia TaxID=3673 RepID=A0A6J1BWX9_MOMCH|nr:cytochrome P450 724B1 [Momordica charantia]
MELVAAAASLSPATILVIALSLAMAAIISHSLLKLSVIKAAQNYPNLPPGSMGFPFLGQTLGLLKPHPSNSIGTFLHHHCSRYGKVFKSHLFGWPAIVSCDQELNMFILQNDDKLFKVSYPKAMHGILGTNSLIIAAGDTHRKLRNVVVSFIGWCKSRPSFLHCVHNLTISLMDSWRSQNQVFFCKEVKMFALSIMVKELLGIEAKEAIGSKILEEFEKYMKGFVSLPINLPGTAYSNAVKARERLSCMVKEMMRERKRRGMVVGADEDFLQVIMSNWKLNDEEIVSVVLDILLGGYETTATLMGLIVYFLAHSPPNVLAKLKEEHEAIRIRKRNGESLNLEDYKQMEFTNNVMFEAMRCGNVVKFLHREAVKDVKFKEIVIPSGWKVHPVFSAVHLDPALHPNPQQFNPWRWTDDKEMGKKVTPFGGGPRLCPGVELAKLEISFFLHHLVLNYRWKTRADECPLAYPYVQFKRDLLLEIEPCSC